MVGYTAKIETLKKRKGTNPGSEKLVIFLGNTAVATMVNRNMIFTTIAVTGVISGIARGSNQTAIAHKFYEATRFLFPEETKEFTHGELVGVGLLLQNHFNGEEENNAFLLKLMKKYNMPCSIEDLHIEKTKLVFDAYYEKISNSSAIENEEEKKKLIQSLQYLWNHN